MRFQRFTQMTLLDEVPPDLSPAAKATGIIDLFAGAGGLSLGFEAAGFHAVAAVELDADAASTYAAAREDSILMLRRNICEVDFTPFAGAVAAVVGGPPCQPWSLGGFRRGHADPRDGIPQFARVVHEVQPQAFVMENVAGLTKGTARADFERVLDVFRGHLPLSTLLGEGYDEIRLDYRVDFRVLQAADYGVPQRRERTFVVGVAAGLTFEWPTRTHGPDRRWPHKAVRQVISAEPAGTPNRSIVTYAKNPTTRPDPYHGQIFNGGGRPMNLDRPAPTLLASMGGNKTPWIDLDEVVPDYHQHLMEGGPPRTGTVPGARRITVAEAAAIQTFPKAMSFSGARSSQYRQIGNAVPPKLAEAVARQVLRALATPQPRSTR